MSLDKPSSRSCGDGTGVEKNHCRLGVRCTFEIVNTPFSRSVGGFVPFSAGDRLRCPSCRDEIYQFTVDRTPLLTLPVSVDIPLRWVSTVFLSSRRLFLCTTFIPVSNAFPSEDGLF